MKQKKVLIWSYASVSEPFLHGDVVISRTLVNALECVHKGKTILYTMEDDHVRTIIIQGCKHIEESFKARSFIHR